jgi:hypothetical protein
MAADREPGPRALWGRRYSSRAPVPCQEHARQYVDGALVIFDPDGPYPGIDGSAYHPGGLDEDKGFPAALPVVLVASRGMTEVLVGWASWREMLAWVASRGTTGTGELEAPPAAASARCVREDAVLAYALRGQAAAVTEYLPPDTFTSDVRFEVFAAIADAVRSGLRVNRERVAAMLREREALIPPRERQEHYGGAGLPWAQAYLRRLDQSWPSAEDARSAAASLRAEDRRAVARQAAAQRRTAAPQRAAARQDPGRRVLTRVRRPEVPASSAVSRLEEGSRSRGRTAEQPRLGPTSPRAVRQRVS